MPEADVGESGALSLWQILFFEKQHKKMRSGILLDGSGPTASGRERTESQCARKALWGERIKTVLFVTFSEAS
ncbi:hypothetical protein ACI01nite_10940 [Acetobacter cibinongensis]|uniref:Uncharacterized protein n=1 Tax=Acetobacter cibinongensis TaxID=146475 RepID=A0A0D6N691_9PROT|nr:hypothetical protein Abci_017_195 [Acetobacter cibinongensis]GBQ12986.1 hypothetical protein AA0482_0436 [Acetobacter cibinongensis NRIC 0482]GEL58492.1 hypothetical protein ACI01nite_10940 [Acetobacter cibinongensis]